MISSSSNPRVKFVRQLRDKKQARSESGLIFVEGLREIQRAVECGLVCDFFIYCPDILDADQTEKLACIATQQAPLVVSKDLFRKMVVRENGAIAAGIFIQPQRGLSQLRISRVPLVLVVEGLEKPGNLGALLRSADGAGVDAILLTEASVEVFNPNVIRASLGTVFRIPVIPCTNQVALDFLSKRSIRCFAATPSAKCRYYDADFGGPSAIVLGNEAQGLSDFWLSQCAGISLPMQGIADSLNISVTGAILVYEILRQRSI